MPNDAPHPQRDSPGSWSADDAAKAACQIAESWASACTPLPDCVCVPVSVVGALFVAEADESASFDCDLAKRFDVEVARELVPSHPTLGDVDSAQALADYQAAKKEHKAQWMASKSGR